MGTLFSALDIARSGLQTAQIQLDISAHNIANVNKEGFSRQRAEITSRFPNDRPFGQLGRGVQVQNVIRIRDTFLDIVLRQEVATLGAAEVRSDFFTRLENLFLEPGGESLGVRVNTFFDALNDFADNVEILPARQAVVSEAQSVASGLNEIARQLFLLRSNANEEVRNIVPEINSVTDRIAALNVAIRQTELSGTPANDLRDDRDVLLDDLARLVNIQTQERDDGQIDVLVSGDVLVNGGEARDLEAVVDPTIDPDRGDLLRVQFVDNAEELDAQDGELFATINVRDNVITGVRDRVDTLTAGFIEEINRIHTQGNGLANLSGTISSTNFIDAATALDGGSLPFDVTAGGTFDIIVDDGAGTTTTTTITVNPGDTLNDLQAALDAIPNFSAGVVNNNQLDLGADPGFTYSFANDSAGILTALGINGLFTGSDATTIGVNQTIADSPALLTSAFDPDPLATGDNSAALALADVRNATVFDGGTSTINDFYESTIVRLGIDANANAATFDVEQAFVREFEQRRQQVSGVSLDEEVTNILQFQRAFEASARVVTTTDRMLEALLNIVR